MKLGTTHGNRAPHPLTVARKGRKITLRELAEMTELSVPGLSHIETMRSDPFPKTRRKIEKALGCKIDWPQVGTNGSVNGRHNP
ncbi:MAG TPA: helix-turn-helix transcriptional regulator [Solirubrobacteraceae bacterium]|jgi:transcriptional regulator with XRE-family HTH domain|nr:helix-turn-helix transcriptional regulator [Solirubrobacteraceae bacterium]